MSMLHELLRLKEHRENKAEMAVSGCRMALAEAVQQEETARGSLVEYRHWSVEQERGMYAAVCRRVVRARDLEWLREDVLMLRVKERDLEDVLHQREKQRDEADHRLQDAREVHRLASRVKEKFIQLVEVQSEEIRLESERKEDVEMEDLYAVRKEREDWGGGGDD
ncbi:type III secretion system stalk subunit SctO [Pseudothauera rhizosphaerae]|uniref:Type III secretion protein YscO n=1 Tax=Pseudothauera rhizosphaerae TaxID=2565932 RepID=A0A4S4AE15_9RHOO|nr:YscO family type III secretion system apparatus protein [Pseudothauera rhizosphaerae]THF57267.1 hypothetical protein E6O51_18395 [Pseudothauera rhizosphaerae]